MPGELANVGSTLTSPTLVLNRTAGRVVLYDEAGTIVTSVLHKVEAETTMQLFGAGIVGGEIWLPGPVAAVAAVARNPAQLAGWWEQNSKGAMCLFAVWSDGQFLIAPDPVGAAPIYFHHKGDLLIASASIPSLRSIARMYGIELRPSIGFALEVGLLGNGGMHQSSFEDVWRSEPFGYLRGSASEWSLGEYGAATTVFEVSAPLDQLSHEYRGEINAAFQAILDTPVAGRRIVNLTGGLDSRVLLAALKNQGRSGEPEYYTSGAEGTQDVDTADGLARVLGLRRTSESGLGGTSVDMGPGDAPRFAMRRTGGLSRQGNTGFEAGGESIIVGGLYGMFTHSNVANRIDSYRRAQFDPWEVARGIYPGPAFADFTPERSLFSRDFQSMLVENLGAQVSRAEDRVPIDDFVLDYLFLNNRNRFHAGIIQASASTFAPRVDPLYSLEALRLGIATPSALRGTNVHQFDAINHWAPDLLSLPFDSDKFNGLMRSIRRVPLTRSFSEYTTSEEYAAPTREKSAGPTSTLGPDARRAENLAAARSINAPYWQVRLYSDESHLVNEMLSDVTLGLSQFLNVRGVRWIIRNALRNKSYLRIFVDLLASLNWLEEASISRQ